MLIQASDRSFCCRTTDSVLCVHIHRRITMYCDTPLLNSLPERNSAPGLLSQINPTIILPFIVFIFTGTFKIIYSGDEPLSITPSQGSVPARSVQTIRVEYVTRVPGTFYDEATWVFSFTHFFFLNSHSGIWPSYWTHLLSLRLVGGVGARMNVRSSYSQRWPAVARIRTQVLTVASPAFLMIDLPRYPIIHSSIAQLADVRV